MSDLSDLYNHLDHRIVTTVVRLGQILLSVNPIAVSWTFRKAQVPSCTMRLPLPLLSDVMVEGVSADVFVGFGATVTPVFSGKIESVAATPSEIVLHCSGRSRGLDVPYRRSAITLDNVAATAAVTTLLQDAGITYFLVDLPAWQLGTPDVQTIEFQSFGEAVNQIAEVDGSPWYEMPDGQVRVELRDPIPSASVFRQYFSGVLDGLTATQPDGVSDADAKPRIHDITSGKRLRDVRNRVTVRGAPNPATQENFEATAQAASPWIGTPPGFIDFFISNSLIQSQTKATETAIRHLGLQNRLIQEVDLGVDGDPEVFLGATVEVIDPEYSGVRGRFVVVGYTSTLSAAAFETMLELEGGLGSGTTPQVAPVAAFSWKTDLGPKLQQVTPAGQGVFFTFDGGASRDFDGEIALYSWSDTQANVGTGRFFTVAYDPTLVSSVDVTLTVTDGDGLTDSITQTVDVPNDDDDDPLGKSFIAVAARTHAMLSVDGGVTWVDANQAALGIVSEVMAIALLQSTGGWMNEEADQPAGVLIGTSFSGVLFADENLDETDLASVALRFFQQLLTGTLGINDIKHFPCVGHIYPSSLAGANIATFGAGFLVGYENGQAAVFYVPYAKHQGGDSPGWHDIYDPTDLTKWGILVARLTPNLGASYPIKRVRFAFYYGMAFLIGGDTGTPASLVRGVARRADASTFPTRGRIDWPDINSPLELYGISLFDYVGWGITTGEALFGSGAWLGGPGSQDLLDAIALAGGGHHAVDFDLIPPRTGSTSSGDPLQAALLFNTGVAPRCWVNRDILGTATWEPVTGLPAGIDGRSLAQGVADAAGLVEDFVVVLADDVVYHVDLDTLVAVARDTAPSEIQDYIQERGFDGVYIGAADDGIVKSLDANVNVDYIRPHVPLGITWPAGANGKRISWRQQIPRPRPQGSGDLYTAVEANNYYRLGGDEWVVKDSADAPPNGVQRLRYLEQDALVHGLIGVVTAPRASLDNGETWNDLNHPQAGTVVYEIAIDAGGRWWAAARGTAPDSILIFWSDDQGTTWTLSRTTLTGTPAQGGFSIACHPTDQNKIMVSWNTGGAAVRLERSTDRGASWSTISPAGTIGTTTPIIRWLTTDRIVLVLNRTGANPPRIYISDDQGANFTLAVAFAAGTSANVPIIVQGGVSGPLFVLGQITGGGAIYRSLNQGDSWELCGGDLPDGGLAVGWCGLAYDYARDRLYLMQVVQGILWQLDRAAERDITAVVEADWIEGPRTANSFDNDDLLTLMRPN